MVDIPGVPYMLPGVVSEGTVVSSGVAVPANNRILCVMGEGAREEVIVNYALGKGQDGWDASYTSTTKNMDGRHFVLSTYPIVSNRTILQKNGITLAGKEESIPSNTILNSNYDYRIDISNGRIELQGAIIEPQDGQLYSAYGANKGNGTITNLSLVDENEVSETWTIRCSAVRRDINGDPIDGYAKFIVSGSVSGIILDGYGSPIVWQSDGTIRTNGILKFAIDEGAAAFDVNDTFTIITKSGVLNSGDKLSATYIGQADINTPKFFTDMDAVTKKHGTSSTTNTLSLAASLAFTNGAPGVYCCQAAPGLPRRNWYRVVEQATGGETVDDLEFILPIGVVPDSNSEIKFILVNTTTNAETQILPNKVAFYDSNITAAPADFINNGAPYSYTVIMNNEVVKEGEDLVLVAVAGSGPTYTATISSETVDFDQYSVTMSIHIFGATNTNNNGVFTITNISKGKLTIESANPFVSESDLHFKLIDTSAQDSAYILFTKDLALSQVQGLKVGVIDTKDASFYDAGWSKALSSIESIEIDMLGVYPTQTKSAIIQNAMQHCLNMSRIKNRKERTLLTGAIQGLTPENIEGLELAAIENIGILEGIQGDDPAEIFAGNIEDLANYSISESFGSTFRCRYMYPDRIVVTLNGSNTYVDGLFMGAAYGGSLSASGNVAIPLTNKTISGFSILSDRTFNTTVSENIAKAGAILVQPIQGGGLIVWDKTTSQSGYPEEEESSICFIRDAIAKKSRADLSGFIGQVDTPSTIISMEARVKSSCISFIKQGLINDYGSIIIKRDEVEPRQWNVKFAVKPVYAINWIWISFSIGTIA